MAGQPTTSSSAAAVVKSSSSTNDDEPSPPIGLRWRSHTIFILCTVGFGAFTDMFLYGIIVPVLPFILSDRVHIPEWDIQRNISNLLAIYAAASMLVSPIAGILADKLSSTRQIPFLLGLLMLLLSTILLAVGRSIPVLAIARLLQGASGGTVWTVGLALLTETVGQNNLGKTIGTVFSFVSVAALFSPIIGGLLYAKTGSTGVFGLAVAMVALDFIMRLLMIEKKVAAKYHTSPASTPTTPPTPEPEVPVSATESTPLLIESQSSVSTDSISSLDSYHLPDPKNRILKAFPILLMFRDPALLTGLFMSVIQAVLLGAFDATIPIVASQRYNFDSLKAGLLFFPLGSADFLLGPFFGWAVDRWGTKLMSVTGFLYYVPALVLLRLPVDKPSKGEMPHQIALYAALLGVNGIGLAIINSPSVVECGSVMEKYSKANPQLYPEPPYAQLYGLNSMTWSLGLTIGPLVSGKLRETIGYGDMNAVLAGVCAFTAVLGFFFVGGKVRFWRGGDEV